MPTGCLINKKRDPGEKPGVPHHFYPFRLQHNGGSLPFSRLFPNNCQNKTCQTRFAGPSFPTPYLLKFLVTFKGPGVGPDGHSAEAKSSVAGLLADNEPTAMTGSSGVNSCG